MAKSIKTPVVIPRQGGATALQKRQKTDSRKRILDATEALLSEMSYLQATVEQIAARAKVTKITFYRHFTSKLDVANAVFAKRQPPLLKIFSTLTKNELPDQARVREWLSEIISHFTTHKVFLSVSFEMAATERQHPGPLFDFYAELTKEMAKGTPEFAVARRTKLGRARALLLVRQTLQFCFDIVQLAGSNDSESLLSAFTGQFFSFLEDMRAEGATQRAIER